MIYAVKHKKAPAQRSIAKPPHIFFNKITHDGVGGVGVNILGPSVSSRKAASVCDNP